MAASHPTIWRWSLLGPAAGCLLAVLLQFLPSLRTVPPTRAPHLGTAVPLDLPGWRGREVPLGPTEFMSGEVEKVLRFDEAVSREYTKDGRSFTVYAAYWGAGKMPTQLVASHTPDRCWTENGWRCLEMKFRQQRVIGSEVLQPAEWRLFAPPRGDQPVHVMYWHLVEGVAYNYGARLNSVPDPMLWAKDAVRQALLGNREQYFIRLTSTEPLEELWDDPGFSEVLRGLAGIGLAENSNRSSVPL